MSVLLDGAVFMEMKKDFTEDFRKHHSKSRAAHGLSVHWIFLWSVWKTVSGTFMCCPKGAGNHLASVHICNALLQAQCEEGGDLGYLIMAQS